LADNSQWWQRLKWLLVGTSPEHWKRGQRSKQHPSQQPSDSDTSSIANAASPDIHSIFDGNSHHGKQSRFSLADIFEKAVMRTKVVRDEDVAGLAQQV